LEELKLLNIRWTGIAASAILATLATSAKAAESGLLGIKLFDSLTKVVTTFGNPDDIQAISIGGMSTGGGGGMGGGGGAPMGGRPGSTGPSMGGGAPRGGGPGAAVNSMDFGDWTLRQKLQGPPMGGGARPNGGPPQQNFGGPGAPPGMGPNMGGGGGGMAPPSAGGGASESATFTRYVYNRSGCKYGFIIDGKGRVVQIEAIGLVNHAVHTSKGVTFGTPIAEVIKKYSTPDGYDISGDNVMTRYLSKNKVAFRFSRLGPGKPQVVTGIVVAAGK
jgi:hypothetical protein